MKYLITQTLLNSWSYVYKSETGYVDFLATLNREKTPPTEAQLQGQRFENIVNEVCKGVPIGEEHEWFKPVTEIAGTVHLAQQQVKVSRDLIIEDMEFVVYGILDFLYRGEIYDTKFSKTYSVGKYLDYYQHPFYFYLVPEAYRFTYLISDGKYVFKESYTPDITESIERPIKNFIHFLENRKLLDTYKEKWASQY